jgi:23S rRNA (adenine2503-C2)-methyltransferase
VQDLLELSPEHLAGWFAGRGLPGYRAAQVRRWLFQKRAGGFDQMTDLPRGLREELAEEFRIWTTQTVRHQTSEDGTEKLLLELADGQRIECVLLRDDGQHRTICISTQVGCAMGCVFCASGLDGVVRNLTSGEIIEQMLRLARLLPDGERLSHVVVMGMGEPLANLDRLLVALASATDPDGLGISARRKVGIAAILAAADDYFQATGRRVTFEYVLLARINDRPRHARKLAALLAGRAALVNVIPYNAVAGLAYRTPAAEDTARFVEILQSAGVAVKVRYRKGDRIEAACGQLRRRPDG